MVQEMSQFGKVVRTFGFLNVFGAAEKIQAKLWELLKKSQGAAEENKEKVEANSLASQQSSLVLSQKKCSVLPGKQKFKC